MNTWVALLRGINVSGKNMIRMNSLAASMAGLGLVDVRTYLQSGNAVFRCADGDGVALAAALAARIRTDFGHDVQVLVLAAEAFASIVRENPLAQDGVDESTLHCTLFLQTVSPERFGALKPPTAEGEQAVFGGAAVFLHCPHGYGKTKLNNAWFERALGVGTTTRNWRTMLALRQLCGPRG